MVLEKFAVAQLVMKLHIFYGTRRFSIVFTRALQWAVNLRKFDRAHTFVVDGVRLSPNCATNWNIVSTPDDISIKSHSGMILTRENRRKT
jgi:hypothetical protein